MRIFVTGGTGFIGKHFLREASARGDRLIALHRAPEPPPVADVRWVNAGLDSVPGSELEGCETLVHFAAHGAADPQNATWEECFQCNVTASLALWRNALRAGVRRFIICGSCFEYGSSGERFDFIPPDAPLMPTGPYHASKAAASMAALGFAADFGVKLAVLRPFHVYGEGEAAGRFWPSLKRAAQAGEDFPMTEGGQVRDFSEAGSVARIFQQWAHSRELEDGKPVVRNIGSGRPSSLLEFARSEWERFGAAGRLLPGAIPGRKNEVMRYVPLL